MADNKKYQPPFQVFGVEQISSEDDCLWKITLLMHRIRAGKKNIATSIADGHLFVKDIKGKVCYSMPPRR